MIRMPAVLFALALACVSMPAAIGEEGPGRSSAEPAWWKGNTHTHTLWSDGDTAPEVVADWYRSRGYQFLVLSDHNILSEGEKWVGIGDAKGDRVSLSALAAIEERFGRDWVVTRESDGRRQMRLKTLDQLRAAFEEPGREFVFIQGEEITDAFEKKPIHTNALNLDHVIPPQGGSSVRDVMARDLEAVRRQADATGRAIVAHLNHPNFGWAVTPDDIAHVLEERFFEVYNGHPMVRNYGDAEHPGMEETWDHVLTLRLGRLGGEVLYGLATDDAHHYFETDTNRANPGRGWICVRAASLDAEALVGAIQAGDFYASSGVALEDVHANAEGLAIRIAGDPGVAYTTRFFGTRVAEGVSEALVAPGELLAESRDLAPVYRFRGDELYVRATVTSDRRHPNGYAPDDFEKAWIQPAVPARRSR